MLRRNITGRDFVTNVTCMLVSCSSSSYCYNDKLYSWNFVIDFVFLCFIALVLIYFCIIFLVR